MSKYTYITFEQRRKIERLHNNGVRTVDIAAELKRSVAAVYEELKRGYTGERNKNYQLKYSADKAQLVFQNNIERRGNSKTMTE